MKRLIYLFLAVVSIWYVSCKDQFYNIKDYSGEVIYPACFDTIVGFIGYERVEIDLLKVGRLPSSKLKLGKATKTVIEYDGKVQKVIDSVCSWVNITGLTDSKLYRFNIYTEDDFGNQSVPQEIALIPFTSIDRDLLGIASPKLSVSTQEIIAEWPNGLSSVAMRFQDLSYSYVDKDGKTHGEDTDETWFRCKNLESGQKVQLKMDYRVIPIVDDEPILDVVTVSKLIDIEMPSGNSPLSVTEIAAIRANGLMPLTAASAESVKKIIFPMHIGTLSDLFYFPNLEELDLTGQGLENVLPTMTLAGNGVSYTFGGGNYQPYMQRIEYTKIFKINPPISSTQFLLELLEKGTLKKIRYIENSLSLDEMLEPYIANGVVQFVQEEEYPQEAPLDPKLVHNGKIVTNDFDVQFTITTPLNDVPKPEDLNDPSQVYKVSPIARNATIAWTLSKEYMYDFERYRYLKFKVYMVCTDESDMKNGGPYANYMRIWPRIRYSMWGPDQGNNPFGNGDNWEWKPDNRDMYRVPEQHINTSWWECTMDMKQVVDKITAQDHPGPYNNPARGHYHSRNICFSLSGEQGPSPYRPNGDIIYYFGDVRLCKTP